MNIKKLGHCCLLIDTGKIRILTDPGSFTVEKHVQVKDIDVILITHEHADHLHTNSLHQIMENNPEARILTNSAVAKILEPLGIVHEVLEGESVLEVKETLIEAYDAGHEEIYEELGQVQNTGYFIDNKLFYPGDSFANPGKEVSILALPVAGPWCRIGDSIKYALQVGPEKAFPVHDGMIKPENISLVHRIPGIVLAENNIRFIPMETGDEKEL